MAKFNPSDRVLIEAVVTKDWPEGNCVCVNGGEWVARERIHPMPEVKYVLRRDALTVEVSRANRAVGHILSIGTFCGLYDLRESDLPRVGNAKRVRLVCIDAEEEG